MTVDGSPTTPFPDHEAMNAEDDLPTLLEKLRDDIGSLHPLEVGQLQKFREEDGKVILQVLGFENSLGNSLRVDEQGKVDMCGGAGPRASFDLQLQRKETISTHNGNHVWDVSLRSSYYRGQSLRSSGSTFDFEGIDNDANVILTMVLVGELESKNAVVTIFSHDLFLGTFALWWAWDPTWRWWREDLLKEAREWMQKDENLQGRRRHPKDLTSSSYSFIDWVKFYDELDWGGAVEYGSLVLAKYSWEKELVDDDADEVMLVSKEPDPAEVDGFCAEMPNVWTVYEENCL